MTKPPRPIDYLIKFVDVTINELLQSANPVIAYENLTRIRAMLVDLEKEGEK